MATIILSLENEIKPYLDANDASASDEAFLEQMEANMIGVIEADTNWRFREGSAGEVFVVDGEGGMRLWAPQRPISLSKVEVRYSLSSAWEEIASTAYEVSSSRNALRKIDGVEWPAGEALIRLTGQWGYANADVPKAVRQLLLEMLNWMYRRGRKTFGEKEVIVRMKSDTNFDLILKPYRSPVYG